MRRLETALVLWLLVITGCAYDPALDESEPLPEQSEIGTEEEALTRLAFIPKFYVTKISFQDMRNGNGEAWMAGAPPVAPSKTWKLAAIEEKVFTFVTIHTPSSPTWLQSGYCHAISPKVNGWPVVVDNIFRPDKYTLRFKLWLQRTTEGAPAVLSGLVSCGGGVEEVDYEITSTPIAVMKTSAFAAMNPTFDHPRCTTCHSLGDGAAWLKFHKNFFSDSFLASPDPATIDVTDGHVPWTTQNPGKLPPSPPFTPFSPGSKFSHCTGCHSVEDWRAPPFSNGTDWQKVVTPTDRCNVVAANLPTAEQRNEHFRNDPRLLWSYYSGERNCGGPSIELSYLPEAKGEHIPLPDVFRAAEEAWSADTVFGLPSCINLDASRKAATYPL